MPSNTTRRLVSVREETSYRYLAIGHCDEAGKVRVEFEPICAWADYEVTGVDQDGDKFEMVESLPLIYDGDTATEMFFDTALGVAMHGDGKDWLGMAEKMFGTDAATVKRAMGVN